MAPLHVFAAHHPRSCSASSPFCVPDDVRGKILPSSDSHNCSSHKTSAKPGQNSPFQIIALRTLSFSVACKSFVCHSYESLMVIIVVLSFHALTNCKFHNSFLLIFMQNAGGVGGRIFRAKALLSFRPQSGRTTKIVCAKRRAALRCRHFPPRGGFRETTNTNSRTFPVLGL